MSSPVGDVDPSGLRARLREDALAIFRAALAAAEPAAAVRRALEPPAVRGPFERSTWALIAAGKAAGAMLQGTFEVLPGDRLTGGVAVLPDGAPLPEPSTPARALPIEAFRAGHPLPDLRGVRAAQSVERLAQRHGTDRFLVLLSGGASALLPSPAGEVGLADKVEVTRLLLRAGADIVELNTVRKHLSRLKGGGLARFLAPRPVLALVLSDVIDDDLSVVGSGPLCGDPSTYAEAMAVLESHRLLEQAPPPVIRHLERGARGELQETPKPEEAVLAGVEHIIVGSNQLSLEAAAARGRELGYAVWRVRAPLRGEAREAGPALLRLAAGSRTAPTLLLAGGETTVSVRGPGRGGRNQELALSIATAPEALPDRTWTALCAGTDGVDGPTDAAGALVDAGTATRCRVGGVDPMAALEANDSHAALAAAGDLVRTGPTGTNVGDVFLLLMR